MSFDISELHQNIQNLNEKIDKLEDAVIRDQLTINAHPLLFIILLVGFFVTMNFWSIAANSTINTVHPRGYLHYWEYILIALAALLLLVWFSKKTGIRILQD